MKEALPGLPSLLLPRQGRLFPFTYRTVDRAPKMPARGETGGVRRRRAACGENGENGEKQEAPRKDFGACGRAGCAE
jgi:hypothetical protein